MSSHYLEWTEQMQNADHLVAQAVERVYDAKKDLEVAEMARLDMLQSMLHDLRAWWPRLRPDGVLREDQAIRFVAPKTFMNLFPGQVRSTIRWTLPDDARLIFQVWVEPPAGPPSFVAVNIKREGYGPTFRDLAHVVEMFRDDDLPWVEEVQTLIGTHLEQRVEDARVSWQSQKQNCAEFWKIVGAPRGEPPCP